MQFGFVFLREYKLDPAETKLTLQFSFSSRSEWCGRGLSGRRRRGGTMGEITNVMEYQAIAKQKLPKMAYDYYASGAEDEWTLNENREAFSRIL